MLIPFDASAFGWSDGGGKRSGGKGNVANRRETRKDGSVDLLIVSWYLNAERGDLIILGKV